MNAIPIQGNQKQDIKQKIKYVLVYMQYVQGKQVVAKGQVKPPDIYFINITDQAMEVRVLKQQHIQHSSLDQQISFPQILKMSILLDSLALSQIIKVQKKVLPTKGIPHYIIGVYDNRRQIPDKNKASIVLRLVSQKKLAQFQQQINIKVEKQKQFLKKSQTNYLGIHQNIRKVVEKILISSFAKREILNRMNQRMLKNNIHLNSQQNKMMVFSLVGNNVQMQNFMRKQRIQVFDIQKKKYQDQIKQQNFINLVQPCIIEGYSEKRKLDGVVAKRLTKKQQIQANNMKNMEDQFFERIDYRSEMVLDEFLGLQNNFQKMQIQHKVKHKLPQSYRVQKVKIPVKQYSLISKDLQLVRKQQIIPPQVLDKNVQIIIQAIKFMYQLMKTNTRQKLMYSLIEGPLDKVLDCLKDVLTQCAEEKRIQNKSVIEFYDKANKNYLAYRKNPNKFY